MSPLHILGIGAGILATVVILKAAADTQDDSPPPQPPRRPPVPVPPTGTAFSNLPVEAVVELRETRPGDTSNQWRILRKYPPNPNHPLGPFRRQWSYDVEQSRGLFSATAKRGVFEQDIYGIFSLPMGA